MGLPAVAFSLCTFTDPIWETAAAVARRNGAEAVVTESDKFDGLNFDRTFT